MKTKEMLLEREHVTGSIPHWLREEIKSERLICNLASLADPFGYWTGDAEVVACLMVNSKKAHISQVQSEIYLYLAAKLLKRQGAKLNAYMADKLRSGLTSTEKLELKKLRKEIYMKGGMDILYPATGNLHAFKKQKGGVYEQ